MGEDHIKKNNTFVGLSVKSESVMCVVLLKMSTTLVSEKLREESQIDNGHYARKLKIV